MKFLKEFRDPQKISEVLEAIKKEVRQEYSLMEICGGQTHSILKNGIDLLLPSEIKMIHGPGCPVCVTPISKIDQALLLAQRKDVIFCCYGDLMRVPGSLKDLSTVKAQGGDIRVLYNPMDAIKMAEENKNKKIIFFGIGFETTAPAHALMVKKAKELEQDNLFLLVSHVLVPPAVRALFQDDLSIHGLLAAGHVCTITGWGEYTELARELKIPIVATGFEPLDILQGIFMAIKEINKNKYGVLNQYGRFVTERGNLLAKKAVGDVFEVRPMEWRGIGVIPNSGLALRPEFKSYDALNLLTKFEEVSLEDMLKSLSLENLPCGEVLKGKIKPNLCPSFGKCCPENPLGAPMVSTEGACQAYFRYGRTQMNRNEREQEVYV